MSSSEKQPLQGRVAQILNERELVINIGENGGVRQGMKFAVLSESPTEIRDPETDEVLDVIDREKVRVRAREVRPKVTICKTYLVRTLAAGRLFPEIGGSLMETLAEFRGPTKVVDTFRASDKDLPAPLSAEESYVKINDRVIQIMDDES
jgi:hypothetical protein